MKTNTLKKTGIVVSFIAGMGIALTVEARTLTGQLGQNANALHVWNITCPNTNYVKFEIFDENELKTKPSNTPGFLTAILGRSGVSKRGDDEDDDYQPPIPTRDPTPRGTLTQGSGLYKLEVSKSSANHLGIENYKTEVNCYTAKGTIVGQPTANLQIIINNPKKQ